MEILGYKLKWLLSSLGLFVVVGIVIGLLSSEDTDWYFDEGTVGIHKCVELNPHRNCGLFFENGTGRAFETDRTSSVFLTDVQAQQALSSRARELWTERFAYMGLGGLFGVIAWLCCVGGLIGLRLLRHAFGWSSEIFNLRTDVYKEELRMRKAAAAAAVARDKAQGTGET